MSNQEKMKLVEELSKDMTIDKESRDALKWILKEVEEEEDSKEEEEEEEFNYCNCGIEKKPLYGKISYRVIGNGFGNCKVYATVEFIPKGKKYTDDQYYFCEYVNGFIYSKKHLGNSIIWSDEIYDKENPYSNRSFKIIDE